MLDQAEREALYDDTMEAVSLLLAFARELAFAPPSPLLVNKVHAVRADLLELAKRFHVEIAD